MRDAPPVAMAVCEDLVSDVEYAITAIVEKNLKPGNPLRLMYEERISKACETLIRNVVDSELISVESRIELAMMSFQMKFTFTLITGFRTSETYKRSSHCIDLSRRGYRTAAINILYGAITVAMAVERWLFETTYKMSHRDDIVSAMQIMFSGIQDVYRP